VDNESVKCERKRIRRLLWRWGRVTAYCARRHRDISDFEELIAGVADVRPQVITGMPHGGAISNPTERSAEQLSKLKERYAEKVADLWADIAEELDFADAMNDAMSNLCPIELAVVEYRYKHERRMKDVASELNYCIAQIENIERGAVDKLRDLIKIESEEPSSPA